MRAIVAGGRWVRSRGARPVVAGPVVAGPVVAGPIVMGPIVMGPIAPDGLAAWAVGESPIGLGSSEAVAGIGARGHEPALAPVGIGGPRRIE